MPILVTCQCGTQYTFKDQFAGSRAYCPNCKRMITIPAHVTAEVEESADEAAPKQGGKGVLIFILCATGAVVLLAAVLLVAHYAGDHSPKPLPAAPVPKVSLPSVTPLPPDKDPLLAPPPGKVAATASAAKKSAGGTQPGALPAMTPAELLLPFRSDGTNYYILAPSGSDEEYKRVHDSFRAAHITTVGTWLDWLGGGPDRTPAIAFLRKSFPKGRVLATYENRTPDEERETLVYGDEKAPKTLRVVWLQYQDVGFAVDEVGSVAAIRVTAWPAKPAAPGP